MENMTKIGVIECGHNFCFGCIMNWSKQENTCPLCKSRFTYVDETGKKSKKRKRVEIKVITILPIDTIINIMTIIRRQVKAIICQEASHPFSTLY